MVCSNGRKDSSLSGLSQRGEMLRDTAFSLTNDKESLTSKSESDVIDDFAENHG